LHWAVKVVGNPLKTYLCHHVMAVAANDVARIIFVFALFAGVTFLIL